MKKYLALFMFLAVSTSIVSAEMHEGFRDSSTKKTTISEAMKMNDDSYVTIKGNLVKKLSEDKYTFKDSTGTITVEIDKDKWAGVSADTKDILELTGEIEKRNNFVKLDVDSVKKANK